MPREKKIAGSRQGARSIRTDYYHGRKIVRVTNAKWANNAVANAVKHMRAQTYDSTHCEVYDMESGELHCVLRYSVGSNTMTVIFKRSVNPKEWTDGTAKEKVRPESRPAA